MFRYGGSSWQGTGITTGLDTPPRIGLAQGGQTIGGGLIHGTPMGNRTGFDTPYVEGYNRIFGNQARTPLNIKSISEVGTGTGTSTSTTGTTGSNWRSNLKPPRHWWKEEQWLKRGIPNVLKSIGTNIKRFATGRGILGFPIRFALGNPYVLSVSAIVGGGAYGFSKYMEYVNSLPPEEQAELGIKHEQWGINYLENKGYDTSAIEEFGGTKDWKAVLQAIADKEQEFLGKVERQETIGTKPPEGVTGLDIETVLKESNGKETEIYSSEIEESKLLDKDMDNSIKLIKDQENNAIGSSLNEKEKASATTGGEMPLFDKIYGAQEADIKRNAWLTLAKFGARLMEKPVGVAAEESLTDFEKIAKEKRDLRTITTMKEAEWEHQEELQILKGLSANPSKQMEYIHLLKDKYMREDSKLSAADALARATDYVLMRGASTTSGLIKEAQSEGTRLAIANGETITTRIYDKIGLDIVNDNNLTTANLIRLPKKMIKEKIIVDGKKKKVDKEIINFKDFTITPDVFYFDDKTGRIFQYTGTTPILSWSDLQIATDPDKTWNVYKQ